MFPQTRKIRFSQHQNLRSYSSAEILISGNPLFQAFSALSISAPETSILPSPHAPSPETYPPHKPSPPDTPSPPVSPNPSLAK